MCVTIIRGNQYDDAAASALLPGGWAIAQFRLAGASKHLQLYGKSV